MVDLEDAINYVRAARETEDPKEYAEALRDFLSFHYDLFKADESYSSDELKRALKDNGGLLASDTRAYARVAGFFHGKDRSGNRPKTLEEVYQDAIKNFRDNRADVRPHINALGGDWDTKGAIKLAEDMDSEFTEEFTRQGAHPEEAAFRAKRKVAQKLNEMVSDPKKSYIVLTSESEKASIKLFMDPKSSTMKPIVDENDIRRIRGGITAARANRFNRDPININVMSVDTDSAMPKAVSSQLDDGDLAFTYFGGDGVFIFPERIEKMLSNGVDADWFSTETLDSTDLYKHLIVHETGHLQMYKLWGEGKGSGRTELAKDFDKFKVSKDGTSEYGNESISESFAEQYAKYLITGDASPEFLELLASKGLTKAQINKKWRDSVVSEFGQDKFHSSFFKFIEGIQKDRDSGGIPEYVGQESDKYGRDNEYGTHNTNIVARIMGFREKKPETVATIINDEKVVYRGVSPANGKSAWELHNEFRTKDRPWYGWGYYGNGQYTSKSQSEASGYAGPSGAVAKMRVKDDAKIYVDRASSDLGFDKSSMNEGLNLSQLHRKLFQKDGILEQIFINEVNPDLDPDNPVDYQEIKDGAKLLGRDMGLSGTYDTDRTIFAAMLGFQGVEVQGNYGESYALVLDRSMLQMLVPPGFGA